MREGEIGGKERKSDEEKVCVEIARGSERGRRERHRERQWVEAKREEQCLRKG